ALVHGSGSALLPYWVLGFAFAMVFEWTGSLWASVILHGLWNLAVFLGMVVFAQS
ncbi:MAG TPA: CPBP family intramembrane metalloprotease domain-containing protein, partial [Myxococcales bacterium]|nr:CPBP family intramembrane metalloprotease domain-containing protein [Myxococcales bacterium]